MLLGTRKEADAIAFSLHNAVLCMECESVTENRFEHCPLCGSRSMLNFSSVLGSALPLHKISDPEKHDGTERFDLEFTIDVKEMELRDLNAAIQHITGLIGPRLVRGRAHCHISVEPVTQPSDNNEAA